MLEGSGSFIVQIIPLSCTAVYTTRNKCTLYNLFNRSKMRIYNKQREINNVSLKRAVTMEHFGEAGASDKTTRVE